MTHVYLQIKHASYRRSSDVCAKSVDSYCFIGFVDPKSAAFILVVYDGVDLCGGLFIGSVMSNGCGIDSVNMARPAILDGLCLIALEM